MRNSQFRPYCSPIMVRNTIPLVHKTRAGGDWLVASTGVFVNMAYLNCNCHIHHCSKWGSGVFGRVVTAGSSFSGLFQRTYWQDSSRFCGNILNKNGL